MLKKLLMLAIATSFVSVGYAADKENQIEGYTFPEKMTVEGKELVLNGVGLRVFRKYGLDFKIYVSGLYLEKHSDNSEEILKSDGIKFLKTFYLREITTKDQRTPLRDAINNNCFSNCNESKKMIWKLIKSVKRTKEGGKFDFAFLPEKVKFEMDGSNKNVKTEFKGKGFSKDLLAIFIGPKPPTDDLKNGLLGEGMSWKSKAKKAAPVKADGKGK